MKQRIEDRKILDVGGYGDERDLISLNDCLQNIFIAGSTGTGKSSSSGAALANSLLYCDGLEPQEKVGMVVYLYKASDKEDWLKWAWQNGREEDIIRVGAEHINVYNLLAGYANDEPINAVNALMNLNSLTTTGTSKGSEAFWETAQRKRLDRLIRLNQICGEELNVETLYDLHISAPNDVEQAMSESFAKTSFLAQMMDAAAKKVGEDHRDFKLVAEYFYNEAIYLDERPASTINAMVSGVLEPFVSSKVLSNLFCGTSDLRLEEVFNGKILLMDIPVQQHEFVGRIAQSALAYAIMKAVEKRDLKEHGNSVLFICDECQNFITPFTHLFMSVSRSARAGHVLMTQNISNIMAMLGSGKDGEAKVNSLLGLCNTIITHANNDHLTNEWAAKKIGKDFIDVSSISVDRQAVSSASSAQQLHYLVEPRTWNSLRKGGVENGYLVDAIVIGTGRVFSTGYNFLRTTFLQHFAPTK